MLGQNEANLVAKREPKWSSRGGQDGAKMEKKNDAKKGGVIKPTLGHNHKGSFLEPAGGVRRGQALRDRRFRL